MREKNCKPEDETGAVIQSRAPHLSLAPREYSPSVSLTQLEREFTDRVQAFFQHTHVDEFNQSFMDKVIFTTEKEALAGLLRQRADHRGAIIDLIDGLWRGDRIKAEAKLDQTRAELLECSEMLRRLERVYYKGTSMDETEAFMGERSQPHEV